ncbi:MAG: hypothetical protein COX20_13615 [Desulfobacterales bacterium CG23_combo_of_CG06-09_8_20_14_all_52_9]|nr:MAG: hypothetical protein COX20_13615 [Desulfobacterales bacterium CG23_combo_of_CG06-09_8_20_14_all_52_9]
MEENVIKELDTLKGMLNNWKRGFLSWVAPDGGNDYVLQEFSEDIQMHVYPYVTRLLEAKHLSHPEATEFMDYCYSQVEDLRDQLSKVETNESKKEV